MKYRAFGDFRKGYAHVKNGSGVEDYAGSYNDPQGRYYIGVICDGHSDKNCFRSSKGAQFGCESAIEILTRFFDLYYSQKPECRKLPEGFEDRLKKSLKLCWDKKVYNDIKADPLKKEELLPLTDRVRKIYEDGNGLLNIYGATFLAIGMCEDFFIALHIGDGVILCIDEEGHYYSPVPQDAKSETGAPASLCDVDLFTRENAFRVGVSRKLPQLATVSSDGIEDCMDPFEYKRFICALFRKMETEETEGQVADKLNDRQKRYFESCLEYYADKGHGAEDDCSFAAIYDVSRSVPEIKIPHDEALKLWNRTVQEYNEIVRDYENRKRSLLESMQQLENSTSLKGGPSVDMDQWMEAYEKRENQKRTLRTIVTNENEKIAFYDRQLEFYSQYIENLSADRLNTTKHLNIQHIDEALMEADTGFVELKSIRQDYLQKQQRAKQLEKDLASANKALDDAYDEAKRLAKLHQDDENSANELMRTAKEQYQRIKEDFDLASKEAGKARETYCQKKEEYFKAKACCSSGMRYDDRVNTANTARTPFNSSTSNSDSSKDKMSDKNPEQSDSGSVDSSQCVRNDASQGKKDSNGQRDKSRKMGSRSIHIDINIPWFR